MSDEMTTLKRMRIIEGIDALIAHMRASHGNPSWASTVKDIEQVRREMTAADNVERTEQENDISLFFEAIERGGHSRLAARFFRAILLSAATSRPIKPLEIVKKHRRHVEQSPGIGSEVQIYALGLCNDIISDLERL